MKTKIMRLFVVGALVTAVFVPAQSAFAASHSEGTVKPGWGWGDKKHVHTGPPGLSVKNETNISLSNVFSVMAETGAHVTVNIYNTIVNNFFGNNNG